MQSDLTRNSDNKDSQQSSTVYTQSDFAGGVPMNEPMAERYCSPEAYECSDGIEAGCLDNPHIPQVYRWKCGYDTSSSYDEYYKWG